MNREETIRRHDLDWLRIFGILVVFLYHSTRFFNVGDWHIKNVNTYVWVEVWNVFSTLWMMPLFFIISGASLYYAMEKFSGWRNFFVNKFLRLMVPVLIASVTHGALQVYLDRVTHGQFSGSFLSFIPEYFNGIYMTIGRPGNFAFHGMHLWYLLFLFFYSLCCYPLFVWLRGNGNLILSRTTGVFSMPGLMIVWFLMPLLAMKALIPHDILKVGSGGWGFLYYIWFLIVGFMIVSNDRLQQQIRKQRWLSLLLGVVVSSVYMYQLFSTERLDFPDWISSWIYTLLFFSCAWFWLFSILGFALRFRSADHPWLRYANESVLPFYILHQTILLAVGYFIVKLGIHDALKWALIFAVSFIVIIAIYTLLIRKADLLRFLFGMKTRRPLFAIFHKPTTLSILLVFYIGLTVFAAAHQTTGITANKSPNSLMYDPDKDVLITSEFITDRSSSGVRVVDDEEASMGKAIEFFSGAENQPVSQPEVFIDMRFSAPAGRYTIWLRGKSDIDGGYTDSVWMQVNDHIGTRRGSVRLGNWLDIHPVGIYAWASDNDDPVTIELKHSGDHRIRIQPRQTPHRIDQIWLSKTQLRLPNTFRPIK